MVPSGAARRLEDTHDVPHAAIIGGRRFLSFTISPERRIVDNEEARPLIVNGSGED